MSAYTQDCPPTDCGPCGTLPPGFVRLRYFYGKRLGVVDFLDEQRYHAGKLRFHNQRLHGGGVICGLATSVFAAGETLLRVGKGAALDACGREIVVGYDQCVDVDAWYVRWRADQLAGDPAWAPTLDGDVLQLCVAIRFRECPSGIEPAPRDPCACDTSGNDYGRVREEFQLDLQPHDEAMNHLAPAQAALDLALARALGGRGLGTAIRGELMKGCVEGDHDGWLVLACFGIRLDAARERVEEIVQPIEARATMLYSTSLLEELLARDMAATLEAGAWSNGAPQVDALAFVPGAVPAHDRLQITLTGPVVEQTAIAARYELRRLTTQWAAPAGGTAVTPTYVAPTSTTPAMIRVDVEDDAFFEAGGLYRLTIVTGREEPIVDDAMRPLLPLRPSFHFKLIDNAGTLELAPPPYAEATP